MGRRIVILITVLVIVFILGACAKPNVNTYSKWGFSFAYPEEFMLSEVGVLEAVATDTSGMVFADKINRDEYENYGIAWVNAVKSLYEAHGEKESLPPRLDAMFDNMATVGFGIEEGKVTEESKSGHHIIYQYYIATNPDTGDEAYGITGTFYCDHSERFFDLDSMSTNSSTNEEALEFFRPFLESVNCH